MQRMVIINKMMIQLPEYFYGDIFYGERIDNVIVDSMINNNRKLKHFVRLRAKFGKIQRRSK